MFRLTIVEDEEIIRKGLLTTIDWESLGFTVVGEASNGREALSQWEQWHPDAVLTDIQMADMDGIGLLEEIKKRSPQVEVILLSGYAKFSYAQKGLALDAFAYILKVDLYEEVEDVFTRLREKLENQAVAACQPHLVEEWVRKGEIPARAAGSSFQVWIFPTFPKELPPAWDKPPQNIYHGVIGKYEVYLKTFPNLVKSEPGIWKGLGFYSSCRHNFQELRAAYDQALLLTERTHLKPLLSTMRPLPSANDLWKWALYDSEEAFSNSVSQSFLSALTCQDWSGGITEYRNILLRSVESMASLSGGDTWVSVLAEAIGETDRMLSYLAVAEALRQRMVRMYQAMKTRRRQSSHYIQNACVFIDKNLNLDLGLTEVAQYFYLSPSYFSSLFKKETGKSFSLYVQEKRIRKAASLCSTTRLHNQEIAQLCGFKDEHYLARLFKLYYGITISEYRDSHASALTP